MVVGAFLDDDAGPDSTSQRNDRGLPAASYLRLASQGHGSELNRRRKAENLEQMETMRPRSAGLEVGVLTSSCT